MLKLKKNFFQLYTLQTMPKFKKIYIFSIIYITNYAKIFKKNQSSNKDVDCSKQDVLS
jgi:hypothetical protein